MHVMYVAQLHVAYHALPGSVSCDPQDWTWITIAAIAWGHAYANSGDAISFHGHCNLSWKLETIRLGLRNYRMRWFSKATMWWVNWLVKNIDCVLYILPPISMEVENGFARIWLACLQIGGLCIYCPLPWLLEKDHWLDTICILGGS